jgi:hypothetical protein
MGGVFMKTVRDEMARMDQERFIGRKAELRRMEEEALHPKWRLLHIHGISGLGKTSLLNRFSHEFPHIDCYWIHLMDIPGNKPETPSTFSLFIEPRDQDGCSYRKEEPCFTIELEELPMRLLSVFAKETPTVLLIDNFECWKPHYDWLRKRLLPHLPVHVRIFTASRFPLDDSWTREAGWTSMIHQMELLPFDQVDSFQYMESYGIEEFEICHYLVKFSRGLPLALRKLCEDTIAHGIEQINTPIYKQQFYEYITRCLLQGMNLSDEQLIMLDAASLLWNFNIDTLSRVADYRFSPTSFRQFRCLPIVEPTKSGWRLIHFARYWFRKEFAHRAPEQYLAMQNRAKQHWLESLKLADDETKQELFVNLLYLIDNDMLHTYCFRVSFDSFVIRPLPKHELPAVREMYISFHNTMPAFFRENTYQEQYLETYWDLSPESFLGFYRDGSLALFMSMLPLTPRIRQELKKNPVYSKYLAKQEDAEDETVMWIASFRPEYGASAVGIVFLYGFSQLASRGRMVVMTPFMEAHQLIESIGFEPLPWANMVTDNGLLHKAYRLDLTDVGAYFAKVSSGGSEQQLASPKIPLSRDEMFDHVKSLLIHFHHFEQRADIVGRCPYMQMRCHSRQELMKAAATVRNFIHSVLNTWSEDGSSFSLYGEILRLCYIQKIGTHDLIAHRLNLSMSTYYRYLKKGISHLADAYSIHLATRFDSIDFFAADPG